MLRKLKIFIKKHDRLYVICKSVRRMNDPVFREIIRGYYDVDHQEACTLLLEHSGELMPDKIVYDISRGEEKHTRVGFGASMHRLLYGLKFAEMINAVPRVLWGPNMPYYDHGMDDITKNAFEYYFEPLSEAANYPLKEFKNILKSNGKEILIYQNMVDESYNVNDNNIKILAEMYKKYIHLNEKTSQYINYEINKLFNRNEHEVPSRILGVHVRGTDFNLNLANHPHVITPKEYLAKTKALFSRGKYDKIFIATEDSSVIEMFSSEFGDNILYYKDVFRTSGNSSPHTTPNGRQLNNYKLGLEVLRDVYTLSNCNGFISGLSHVSFAARYVNLALDRKFDEIVVLNEGLNKTDSKLAKEVK